MRVYLAHPVSEYGSERQRQTVALIESRGRTVENPDRTYHQEAYRERGMDHFIEVVQDCDELAFLRFPDGTIGAGVAKEIEVALRSGIRVYDVSDGQFKAVGDMMPEPVLSIEETRAMLRSLAPPDRPTPHGDQG
jgi:hypothetical protein